MNGKERLGTLEPKHSNAYEPIVENVHDTFRKRSCSRKKTNFICDIPSKYVTHLEKAFIFINMIGLSLFNCFNHILVITYLAN